MTTWLTDANIQTESGVSSAALNLKTIALTDANVLGDGPHTRSTEIIVNGQLAIAWTGVDETTETFDISCTASTISGVSDGACATHDLILLGTLTTANADDSSLSDIKKVYQMPAEWVVNDVYSL